MDRREEVYVKPVVVRFGTLAEITRGKPDMGDDLATPFIDTECNLNPPGHAASACRS